MADNFDGRDFTSGLAKTFRSTEGAGVHTTHHNVDAVIPGTGTTNLGIAEDDAVPNGKVGILAMTQRRNTASSTSGSDADAQPLISDTNGRLHVHPSGVTFSAGNVDATTQRVSIAANDALLLTIKASIEAGYIGSVAHDDADANNPLKIGYKAIAHGANPTAVAANDRTNAYASRHGIPWVIGGHPNIITKSFKFTDANGAQTDTALVTVGAGNKIVVTQASVKMDAANTTNVDAVLGFGTANTPTPSNSGVTGILIEGQFGGGDGQQVGGASGIVGIGADNEDLRFTCGDPVSGAVRVTFSYYTVES